MSWTDNERKKAYEELLKVVISLDRGRPDAGSTLVDCDQRSVAIFRLSFADGEGLKALLAGVLSGRSSLEKHFASLCDIAFRVEKRLETDELVPQYVYTI